MKMKETRKGILDKFNLLIQEAESHTPTQTKQISENDWPNGDWTCSSGIGNEEYLIWKARVINLVSEVLPKESPTRKKLDELAKHDHRIDDFIAVKALLKSTKCSFEEDVFVPLCIKVTSGLAEDYLEQANILIEGHNEITHAYIFAAVIAGVVLKNHLRERCKSVHPSVVMISDKGQQDKMVMTELIDRLQRTEAIGEELVGKLRSWFGIINSAIHYKTNDITEGQVVDMIKGIKDLVAGE